MNIAAIRRDYTLTELNPDTMNLDPIIEFRQWLDEAINSEILDPTAMTLATVSKENKPSARIVLLKEINKENNFTFFTCYDSRKGEELNQNSFAALLFFWPQLERQIRIEGVVEKIDQNISEAYFLSRPQNSQIAAWSSKQSKVLANRDLLDESFKKNQLYFSTNIIKKPDNWGGYQLIAQKIEFWQGRSNRMHDRVLYSKIDNNWQKELLYP